MEALEPCPFCRTQPAERKDSYSNRVVYCSLTRCCFFDQQFYVADWNTRPIEDALRARIAQLEEQLERQRCEEMDQSVEIKALVQHRNKAEDQAQEYTAIAINQAIRIAQLEAVAEAAKYLLSQPMDTVSVLDLADALQAAGYGRE